MGFTDIKTQLISSEEAFTNFKTPVGTLTKEVSILKSNNGKLMADIDTLGSKVERLESLQSSSTNVTNTYILVMSYIEYLERISYCYIMFWTEVETTSTLKNMGTDLLNNLPLCVSVINTKRIVIKCFKSRPVFISYSMYYSVLRNKYKLCTLSEGVQYGSILFHFNVDK